MTTKNSYIAEFSEDDGEWSVVDERGAVLYEADMSKLLADTLAGLHNGTVETFKDALLFMDGYDIDLLELQKEEDNATPCTCNASCPSDCKGRCGCEACSEAYADFLSME